MIQCLKTLIHEKGTNSNNSNRSDLVRGGFNRNNSNIIFTGLKSNQMNLDVKKTNPTPKNQYQAIDLLVEAQDKLVDALFIMSSVLANDTEDFKELHKKRISDFIKQFES